MSASMEARGTAHSQVIVAAYNERPPDGDRRLVDIDVNILPKEHNLDEYLSEAS